MGREEARGGDSEGVRREKKQREEDNIYRNYALHEREIVFQFFFFFGKQPVENKPYFLKSVHNQHRPSFSFKLRDPRFQNLHNLKVKGSSNLNTYCLLLQQHLWGVRV